MVNDVSRAYFCAPARRQVFVELPDEDNTTGDKMVGELNFSMYGTRDAAQNWGEECAATMKKLGFQRGTASPCTFSHHYRRLRCYIHGDDFVTVGMDEHLKWMKAQLEKQYELKKQVLGPDEGDLKQVRVLNRVLTWSDEGIAYEADPRHAEIVIAELGLKEAKGVVAPGTKEEGNTKEDKDDKLDEASSSRYRAIVARLNYLTSYRPDIAFAVKEVARSMSSPSKGSQDKLKRLGRYLLTRPRAVIHFRWQEAQHKIRIYSDADWAGCKESRKSTSGGAIMLGQHTLKTWSKTQSLLALSSGENEFYAALKASAEGLGMMSLLKDFSYEVKGEVLGDASAALSIIHCRGLGRTRHIDTGLLWTQQTAAEKRLQYNKVLGTINPADLMTKYLSAEVNEGHCTRPGVQFDGGMSEHSHCCYRILATLEHHTTLLVCAHDIVREVKLNDASTACTTAAASAIATEASECRRLKGGVPLVPPLGRYVPARGGQIRFCTCGLVRLFKWPITSQTKRAQIFASSLRRTSCRTTRFATDQPCTLRAATDWHRCDGQVAIG